MNIFVLDTDPTIAAYRLYHKHIGRPNGRSAWGCPKMAVEGLQMLAGAYHRWGWPVHRRLDGCPYSPNGHPHHRCTVWVREHPAHAAWLLRHVGAIFVRYRALSGKRPAVENTFREARHIFEVHAASVTSFDRPTEFAVADGVQEPSDRFAPDTAVRLYRDYYRTKDPQLQETSP